MKTSLEFNHRLYQKSSLRCFLVSFGWHIAAVGILALFQSEVISFLFNSNRDVEVITSAVKVDLVAMPKMTLQELKSLEAITEDHTPIAKEAVEEVKKEDSAPDSGEDFQNMLKSFSKKDVKEKIAKKEDMDQKFDLSKISAKRLKEIIRAGNKISKGSALTGDQSSELSPEFIQYIEQVRDKIRPFWKLPSFLMNQDLTCRIRVFISSSGKLIKSEILTSSGNETFDERAQNSIKQAIENSGPFMAPGESYLKRAVRGDIVLGFPI